MQHRALQLFVAVLVLAISLPLAIADGYSRNPKLVGHWKYKSPQAETNLVISADGTWSATITPVDQPSAQFEGKWITNKDHIYWVYTKSSTPKVRVGAEDKDRLVEIGANHFELQTRDNRRATYFRVK
jgi:hypothetical protein